ncbi:MAG: GNAT family N-acetyltransferase [Holosporales bacterium]|jgi:ribosomal-protein-alanine N-acetyltransferase|nr:GNAT family N-acetyltransferase [Holosporales bacterium]
MTYRIVPIRRASAQQLAEIHQQCLSPGWHAIDFTTLCNDPAYDGFAIEENQLKIVGFIDLHVVVDEAEVYALCIMPGHRGKGLGRRLLVELFKEAHKRGIRKIFLEVSERNASGKYLYGAFGFKEVGRRCGYYPMVDQGTTAIVLCAHPWESGQGNGGKR